MSNTTEHGGEHAAEKTAKRFLDGVQESSKLWAGESRDAWSALRKLSNRKLSSQDVELIASRLHENYFSFKAALKRQGLTLGDFCRDNDLGQEGDYSKNLHRMMLPPGKSTKEIGLRRSADAYRRLLDAMAKLRGESAAVFADRFLIGTSLHPSNADLRNQVEQVQLLLQAMVDEVDRNFSLYKTFKETAEWKAKLAAEGHDGRWPFYDREKRSDESDEAWSAEQLRVTDVNQAYWHGPVSKKTNFTRWLEGFYPDALEEQMLIQDGKFFYIPHCHLGCDEFGFEQYGNRVSAEGGRAAPAVEDWDAATHCPHGQNVRDNDLHQYFWWLVIYPTPDNSRLMPMIYLPGEEGGAILIPLDAIALTAMRGLNLIAPNGQTVNFYERIKDLIGFREGEPKTILASFQRTAPWLHHNPILKAARHLEQEHDLMASFYQTLTKAQVDLASKRNGDDR